MKKFLAIVMCLTMALAMMTVTSFADDLTITANSATAAPGEVVEIPVTISETTEFGIAQITIYVPTGVSFEVLPGSATSSDITVVGNKITVYNDGGITLADKIITLKVTAPADAGKYDFTFDVFDNLLYDPVDYLDVPATFVDFALTVEAAVVEGDPVMTVVPAEEGTSLMVLEPVGTPVEMGVVYQGEGEYNGVAFKSLAPAGAKAAVKVIGLEGTFAPYANY